ncbi:mercury resistance system transport protein MerF [Maribius pontilimi]|uniref:Mercury resistance system transport protein MerF n=1 Tax=Palleronia pontilimi TaxID=1964209 RepID=A0A934IGU2_9RHOB|nr:mercury resistance system transport protein MerF [Palleronia pontilimi]MBJ3762581.1 mercury resistance system transport protein MerF [Palleronia pontilimi]
MTNRLRAIGIGGTLIAALCCFTPILPIVLSAIGLSGVIGVVYTDAVLLPVLFIFIALTGYAHWRSKTRTSS